MKISKKLLTNGNFCITTPTLALADVSSCLTLVREKDAEYVSDIYGKAGARNR